MLRTTFQTLLCASMAVLFVAVADAQTNMGSRGRSTNDPDRSEPPHRGLPRRPKPKSERNSDPVGSASLRKGRHDRSNSNSGRAFDEYAPTRSVKDEMVALSSKGFAWLTGSPADNDVQSVGKDAQFFGFVNLRYESDHSVQRGTIGRMLYGTLDSAQRDVVISAAIEMQDSLALYKTVRARILRSLEDHLYTGKIWDLAERETIAELYGETDAELGLIQANAIASIASTMSADHRRRLDSLRESFEAGIGSSAPEASVRRQQALRTDSLLFQLTKDEQAYAEDLCAKAFSWITGSAQANETLPVGKPAQFFGFVGLRLKSQHSAKRADISRSFFDLLDSRQQELLQDTVNTQHPLVDDYLATRREFLRELEKLLGEGEVDQPKLLELGAELGRLDVKVAWLQATTYAQLRGSLTVDQSEEMVAIRSTNVIESDELANLSVLERGERLAQLCATCHKPANNGHRVAPSLSGIVGRPAGTSPGFAYSAALQQLRNEERHWTPESLNDFLASPQKFAPGTTMTFKGLLHHSDRNALIDYLQTVSETTTDSPLK